MHILIVKCWIFFEYYISNENLALPVSYVAMQ